MQSRFAIAPSSEVMAILAIANDLADLRRSMDEITAYDKKGNPITADDLK